MATGASRTVTLSAASTLLVLMLADVVIPGETVSLSPLFVLAPMVAAVALSTSRTAVFAGAAVAAAIASGAWNGNADTGQHLVRLAEVALVGAAAVVVAEVRIHRERQVGMLATLADVAQLAVLPVLPAHARRTDIAVQYHSASRDTVIGGDLYDCYHSRSHTGSCWGLRGKGIGAVGRQRG